MHQRRAHTRASGMGKVGRINDTSCQRSFHAECEAALRMRQCVLFVQPTESQNAIEQESLIGVT